MKHNHEIAVIASSLSSFIVSLPEELVTSKHACTGTSTLLRSSPFSGQAWELGCSLLLRNGLPGDPNFDNVAEIGIVKWGGGVC